MAKRYISLYQESGYGLFPSDDGGNFEASFRPHRKNWTTVWLAIKLVISLLINELLERCALKDIHVA